MRQNQIPLRSRFSFLVRFVLISAATSALVVPAVSAVSIADAEALTQYERAKRTRVYVQGDSLTVGSSAAIRRKLHRSVKRVAIDARVSRHTSTGLTRTRQSRQAKRSRVWVMALGTNDAPDPATVKRQVRQTLRMAGRRRQVVWVTIQRPGGYGRVNRMLRGYGKRHKRLHIVDWARYTNRNPHLLRGDRVHATHAGYNVRAAMIAHKVRQVARHT